MYLQGTCLSYKGFMPGTYYGVIYFRDGSKRELGYHSGAGAEQSAERDAAMQFDEAMRVWQRSGAHEFFKPTRYEVKER